jgi:hypothetical protein
MRSTSSEFEFYHDDPGIVATVMIEGKTIKLRTSPEFVEFMGSLEPLDPEAMFQQSIWLQQMSQAVAAGIEAEPQTLPLNGRQLVPVATPEAKAFLDSLFGLKLDDAHRKAVAVLLEAIAKQLFNVATDRDASLLPSGGE